MKNTCIYSILLFFLPCHTKNKTSKKSSIGHLLFIVRKKTAIIVVGGSVKAAWRCTLELGTKQATVHHRFTLGSYSGNWNNITHGIRLNIKYNNESK